jgi:putative FmdB family regulatory protein
MDLVNPYFSIRRNAMPLFEFICEECGAVFEELVRSASTISGVICPDCQSEQVKKKISTFASKVSGSGSSFASSTSAASCSTGSV